MPKTSTTVASSSKRRPSVNWQQALATYADKRALTLLALGFSAGLPLLLIFSSLSLWLREAGVERSTVTLFSWAALFYSFKFVWAPLIDLLPLPWLSAKLGRRRSWLLLAQALIILAVLGLANTDPAHGSLIVMALFAALLGFAAASQDIVIDAYRIESAPTNMQSALAAAYTAGYRLGMLVSGAGALYLATFLGASEETYNYAAWRLTYSLMACLFAVGIATCLLMPEPKVNALQKTSANWKAADYGQIFFLFVVLLASFIAAYNLLALVFNWLATYGAGLNAGGLNISWLNASWLNSNSPLIKFLHEAGRFGAGLGAAALVYKILAATGWVNTRLATTTWVLPLQDFFRRYGKQALILLLIIGFYRITDIVAGVISNVFYQDLGFSKNEIATAVKTVGVLVTLLGGFLGGILAQKYALLKMLFVGGLLACVTNLLFVLLSFKGYSLPYLYLAVIGDNLTAGLASAVFIAFLSALTNIQFTAVQYALFSSLMTLIPKLLGGYSGALVDTFGYPWFFTGATLLGLPVLGLIYYLILQEKAAS